MTYSIDIYNKDGKVVSTKELNGNTFSDSFINETLIHEYYLLQASNARQSSAHTKTRGEVSGSNKKIFKQKGTGNARAGEKRSPIRVGGGIAFGPRSNKNYTKDMNKKSKKLALNGLLTIKAQKNQIIGLSAFDYDVIKTKNAVLVLQNIGIATNKVLLVIDQKNDIVTKSFKNIPNVKYLLVDYLNPFDLMKYDRILFLETALNKINN